MVDAWLRKEHYVKPHEYEELKSGKDIGNSEWPLHEVAGEEHQYGRNGWRREGKCALDDEQEVSVEDDPAFFVADGFSHIVKQLLPGINLDYSQTIYWLFNYLHALFE